MFTTMENYRKMAYEGVQNDKVSRVSKARPERNIIINDDIYVHIDGPRFEFSVKGDDVVFRYENLADKKLEDKVLIIVDKKSSKSIRKQFLAKDDEGIAKFLEENGLFSLIDYILKTCKYFQKKVS